MRRSTDYAHLDDDGGEPTLGQPETAQPGEDLTARRHRLEAAMRAAQVRLGFLGQALRALRDRTAGYADAPTEDQA